MFKLIKKIPLIISLFISFSTLSLGSESTTCSISRVEQISEITPAQQIVQPAILPKAEFEQTINQFFTESARQNIPLLLELQSIQSVNENLDPAPYRTSTFKLIKCIEHDPSSKTSWAEVGELILIENENYLLHTGPFHLELLYIYESYSGQGLGGIALQQLKMLTAQLAVKNPFYQSLSLLSADVYIEQKLLPIVPRRVKFYMDNGFVLHPKTIELMKFLSLKHFVDRLNPDHFYRYIVEYELFHEDILTYKTKKVQKVYASSVLTALKASNEVPSLSMEMILALVKTHGSTCTKNILDRAYYDAYVTDEEQGIFDKYLYYMSLDVRGQAIPDTQIETYTGDLNPSFLQEAPWKNKFTLLHDQIQLNHKIEEMLLAEYNKTPSKKRSTPSRKSSIRSTKRSKKMETNDNSPSLEETSRNF